MRNTLTEGDLHLMKPVPGYYCPILGWRIHEKCTHNALPNTGGTGDSGRVIRRLKGVHIV